MKLAIGCDEAAFQMKCAILEVLLEEGHEVSDQGVFDCSPADYPDIAVAVANEVASGRAVRGILLCGTGIGMAITANKVPGIRAAVCHDPYSAERSRKSNDAQILCLGARVVGVELARYLVKLWLACEFAGGGSAAKVEKMKEYEKAYWKEGNDCAANHQ